MRILHFIFTLCIACYEDKGNYDYTDKLEITVSGIQEAYNRTVGETISLKPQITPANREYDCFWGIIAFNSGSNNIDTISYEQDLDYKISLRTGSYNLLFCAKDKATGIYAYERYNLTVGTETTDAWWVLKENSNGTDLDLITPTKTMPDFISSINGKQMAGAPVSLAFTLYYSEFDSTTNTNVKISSVFVASEQDIVALDYYSGRLIRDYDNFFYEFPQNRKVTHLFNGPSDIHAVIDNHVYTIPAMKSSAPYTRFSIKVDGNYQLSSQYHAVGAKQPLLYDEISSSFCSVTRGTSLLMYTDNSGISPNNMNMELIFIGSRSPNIYAPGDVAYAIMKNGNQYYLINIDGTLINRVNSNPIKEMVKIPSDKGVLNADFRTLNENNDIIYYTKGNDIFACKLDTFEEIPQNLGIGSGETITYMEYVKFAPYGGNTDWFDYVVIATHQNGQYKLYLHPIQAGNIQPAEKVYTGEGKVKKALFIKLVQFSWGTGVHDSISS